MFNNKKGMSELVSFILITFIVVVFSVSAYVFSKNFIDDSIISIDRNNLVNDFKKIQLKIDSIKNFNDATFTYNLDFSNGLLVFNGSSVHYMSFKEFGIGTASCFENLCYDSVDGFEKIYFELDDSYIFNNYLSLNPGNYNLIFTNIKNETKISIVFK